MTLDPDNKFISQQEKKERRRKYLRNSLTDGLSQQIFQYQTLKARLDSKNKSLKVTIFQELQLQQGQGLKTEWLFEMESLVHWLKQHLEVNSVLFQFDTQKTCFPYHQFQGKSQKDIWQFYKRLRKLIHDIIELPQASVFNARNGVTGPWLELFMAFDQRTCGPSASFNWDHLKWGHYPAAGSLALMCAEGLLSKNNFWMLNSSPISSQSSLDSGLVHEILYDEDDFEKILQRNAEVSPTARIQLKKARLEKRTHELDRTQLHDLACLNGTLESGDWNIALQAYENSKDPEFQNPQKIKIELAEKSHL